ncbi:hypothetical protein DPMN_024361 [Dreissena polymorpha]|uniref:Uncharacterized protein n=1 Tax=Dreissena polymorpha TaxID=45954 RepID=A0A9D4LPK9_DREPO|nr:hypothetical protein DPMN_024361 [Dreissena polymorpha]
MERTTGRTKTTFFTETLMDQQRRMSLSSRIRDMDHVRINLDESNKPSHLLYSK